MALQYQVHEPAPTAADRSLPTPIGTWTIDPADSNVSLAWRKLRLWNVTGRLQCVGVIHLQELPPVGVIRFQQPSSLPVLTMALDPASITTGDTDLDAILRGSDFFDVRSHRWWTLRSESMEVLPGGIWRVMATLTLKGAAGLVELRLEVDPEAGDRHSLVLRGRGVLNRRDLGVGKRASIFDDQVQLDLGVRARRVESLRQRLHHLGPDQRPIPAHQGAGDGPDRQAGPGVPVWRGPARPRRLAGDPGHQRGFRPGPPPSDVGMRSPSIPPIGPYRRTPVHVHQADPDAPEVARRLIALIATRWPATPAEHVGSSAVPGLAGKGIIDLLLPTPPEEIPAVTQALLKLGFQPQHPAAFPPTRPMLWGTFRHRATEYRVHVHVVPAGSPEVAAMRGLRDALCADPVLRRDYAALKRAIVAGGPADPVAFTKAKHDWIAATLTRLGLASHPPRRLYHDLDPETRTG
jgi:GrpB-like predicted nucleotidyltransferase (UPF0157 family)/polyisoprenoid-binding protein YceI